MDPWHRRTLYREDFGTVDPPSPYPTGLLHEAQNPFETRGFSDNLLVADDSVSLPNHVIHMGHEPADSGLTAFHPEAEAVLNQVLHSYLADRFTDFLVVAQGWDPGRLASGGTGLVSTDSHEAVVLPSTGSDKPRLGGAPAYDETLARALVRLLSYSQPSQRMDSRLIEALQDLREAPDEADEEGFPAPSPVAVAGAERLLRAIFEILPHRLEVYPTPDRQIAIHAKIGRGSSVIVLCDAEGGAACLVNINGKHRRRNYLSSHTLPNDFLKSALAELEKTR